MSESKPFESQLLDNGIYIKFNSYFIRPANFANENWRYVFQHVLG